MPLLKFLKRRITQPSDFLTGSKGRRPFNSFLLSRLRRESHLLFGGLSSPNPPTALWHTVGFTLVEIMIVLGMTSLLMALFAPTYHGIQKSWAQATQMSSMRQGGLAGTDFVNSHLRQSQGIVSISAANDTNGAISFISSNGDTQSFLLYTYNGQTALGWRVNGVTSPIAVPVSTLSFSAKDKDDNATTIPALIQSIGITMSIADTQGDIPDQDFHNIIKIRKDIISALNYVCFASGNITLPGKDAIMTAGTASPLAMGAGRDFIFSGFDFTAYGTLLAGRNMTFTSYNKDVVLLANSPNPAVLVGGILSINSRDMRISGLIWSSGNSQLLSGSFNFDGILISGGNITGSKPISLRYVDSLIVTPPPYMTGDTL